MFKQQREPHDAPGADQVSGPSKGRQIVEECGNDTRRVKRNSEEAGKHEGYPSKKPKVASISPTSEMFNVAVGPSTSSCPLPSRLSQPSGRPPSLPSSAHGPPDYFSALGSRPVFPSSSPSQSRSGGSIIRREIQQRQKEAHGMDRPRRLDDQLSMSLSKASAEWACHVCTL